MYAKDYQLIIMSYLKSFLKFYLRWKREAQLLSEFVLSSGFNIELRSLECPKYLKPFDFCYLFAVMIDKKNSQWLRNKHLCCIHQMPWLEISTSTRSTSLTITPISPGKKKLLFSLNKKCLRRVQHHQKQRHERTARGCKGRKEEVKRGLESLFFFSLHFENVSWCLRQLVTQSWVVFGTVKRQFSISREAEELLFSSFAHFFIPLASPRVQQSERQWDLQSLAWEHPSQSLFRGD